MFPAGFSVSLVSRQNLSFIHLNRSSNKRRGGMYYVSHIWCNWCRRRMFQEKHSKWKRVDKCKIFSLQESTLISISANNGIRFFQVREGKLVSIHFDEKRRGQTKPETRYEQEIKHLLERLLFCLKTI